MGEFPSSIAGPCQDLQQPLFLHRHVEYSICICFLLNVTHIPTKTPDSLTIKIVTSLQIFSRLLSAPPYWCLQVILVKITTTSICCTPNVYQTLLSAFCTLCHLTSSAPYCKWDADHRQVHSFAQHHITRY